MKSLLLSLLLAVPIGTALYGQANYLESVSGDLSNNNLAPTLLNFDVGINYVQGRMGRPGTGAIDRDIFSFTLGANERLTGFDVLTFAPVTSANVGSFLALSGSGTISTANASDHLSNALVTGPGGILETLAAGAYSDTVGQPSLGDGFAAPLGEGTYTVWFQELSSFVDYRLALTVSAVPEPSTYAMIGASLLVLLCARKRLVRPLPRVGGA